MSIVHPHVLLALTCLFAAPVAAQEAQPTPAPAVAPVTDANVAEAIAPPATPTPAPVRLLFAPHADLFSRYEARRGYGSAGLGPSDAVRYRARLNLQSSEVELGAHRSASVRLAPGTGGLWQEGGDGLTDPGLSLHEAFASVTFGDNHLDVGRFEMKYGEHLVIGSVGWHPIGRAFDGLRYRASLGDAGLDLFATQVVEGALLGIADDELGGGDLWFLGAYGQLGPAVGTGGDLDVYALSRLAPQDTTPALAPDPEVPGDTGTPESVQPITAEVTLGTRATGGGDALTWRLEVGMQLGQRPGARDSVFAYQGDGQVNYALDPITVGVLGFYASGDDPTTPEDEAWNQLYPTAHKFMGFMDFVGARSNVLGGGVLLSGALSSATQAYFNVYDFVRPQDHAIGEAGSLGQELDLGLKYTIGSGVVARFGYGLFLPSEDVSTALNEDLLHFAELELRVNLR